MQRLSMWVICIGQAHNACTCHSFLAERILFQHRFSMQAVDVWTVLHLMFNST